MNDDFLLSTLKLVMLHVYTYQYLICCGGPRGSGKVRDAVALNPRCIGRRDVVGYSVGFGWAFHQQVKPPA